MLIVFTGCGKSDDENTVSNEENAVSNEESVANEETNTSEEPTTPKYTGTVLADFNNPIESYEGQGRLGSDIKGLMTLLIDNATTNNESADFLPNVIFTEANTSSLTAEGEEAAVEDGETYIQELTDISNNIVDENKYNVEVSYSVDGVLNQILITYYE